MKYEYKTAHSSWLKIELVLNVWGEKGWRLVHMSDEDGLCYMIFEKPIPDDK